MTIVEKRQPYNMFYYTVRNMRLRESGWFKTSVQRKLNWGYTAKEVNE